MTSTAYAFNLVDRPRLNKSFLAGLGCRLTLVQAPLGYGKTTVIRRWMALLHEKAVPAVYVSLEGRSNDAESLLRDALGRLIRSKANVGPGSDLGAQLAALTTRHCLIVDDFHEATPACCDLIHSLLRLETTQLHIVIGSRQAPDFALTKMRMARQISDFQLSDLRFTDDEAKALFHGDVDARVLSRAEGWVAALQLLRQSGGTIEGPDATAQVSFVDYLKEQYFRHLQPHERDLLLSTAHLDWVHPDLANLLCHTPNAWNVLSDLAERHALIEQSDTAEGPLYRYHQLLRDFLSKEQLTLGADRRADLHLKASAWYAEKKQLQLAMHHAIAAGDPDLAAQLLLDTGGVQFGFTHGAARLRSCLELLPRADIYRDRRLLVAQAYLLLKSNRVRDGAELLQELRAQDTEVDKTLDRELILVEAHLRIYEDVALTGAQLDALDHACRSVPASDPMMRGLLSNFLCMFLIENGNFSRAREVGQSAMDAFVDLGVKHLQFFMHLHLSTIDLEQGDITSARSHRLAAREICETEFSFDPTMRAHADIYWGELALDQGELKELKKWLWGSLAQIDRQEGWNMLYLAGYESALALTLLEEQFEEAVELLEHAAAVMADRGARLFSNQIRIMELDLAVRAGVTDEAKRLGQELTELLEKRDGPRLRWRGLFRAELALARLDLTNGDCAAAERHCLSVLGAAIQKGSVRFQERSLMLLTAVYAQMDASDQALSSLKELAALAAPNASFGAALREGKHCADTINWTISQNGLGQFSSEEIQYLSECLWRLSGRASAASPNILIELLTTKEVEVFAELVKGHANKVIARSLGVSEPTVKFHLQNIYRKIGVNARKVAIEIGRQNGFGSS